MGCWQCLPLTVVQLKGKHCRKPHCCNGVVDTLGLCCLVKWNQIFEENSSSNHFYQIKDMTKIITKLCNYLKENTSSNICIIWKKLDLIISKKPYSLCHTFQTSTFFIAFFFSFQQSFFSFNLLMQHRCTYFTESFLMAREKKAFF